MPKLYFWPLTMVILGAIMIGTMFGFFPLYLFWVWPTILMVIGLAGLAVADRAEWMDFSHQQPEAKTPAKATTTKKKTM